MPVPSTALQDAVALLTVAMHAAGDELDDLVDEFQAKGRSDELLLAVVALCRVLCFSTARLVHAIDGDLTTKEMLGLTEEEISDAALQVLRAYAQAVPPGNELPTA